MAEKSLDEQLIEKIDGYKLEIKSLKEQVEASQKSAKDIFALDEAKEAIKTGLKELEIQFGQKGVKLPDAFKNIQDQLNVIEGKLLDQGTSGPNRVKSVRQQIEEFFAKDNVKQLLSAKRANPEFKMGNGIDFEVKTLTTADLTAIGTDSIAFGLTAPLEPGVNKAPNNPILFYQLVQKGTVSKEYIAWTERNSVTRGADMRGENTEAPASAITWNEAKADVKKIMDSISVSNETLEDIDYVSSEIMDLMQNNIPKKRDAEIYNGTGLTTHLLGLTATGVAKAFAKPAQVDALQSPDNIDVLATAILQVMLGNNATDPEDIGFAPNAVVINPVDLHNVKLIRDAYGKFKYPELWMPTPSIAGVPIYTTTRIAAGSFLVGDFNMAKYFTRRGMNIRMWDQNGTDPMYDRVTFTASERGVLRVKAHDKFAFVKGTFAAAKTELSNQA